MPNPSDQLAAIVARIDQLQAERAELSKLATDRNDMAAMEDQAR